LGQGVNCFLVKIDYGHCCVNNIYIKKFIFLIRQLTAAVQLVF
jgi:hypothetical protein